MFLVLNVPEFWIYQGSEYARVTEGSEYAWKIPEYAWTCLIMSAYAGMCVNMPKSAWMDFVLHFPFPNLFYNRLSSSTRGYLVERLQETRGYSLKDEAAFLKRQNFIFSVAAGSISFGFCLILNIFTSKVSIRCYLSGPKIWGLVPWALTYPSSVLFFLSQKL